VTPSHHDDIVFPVQTLISFRNLPHKHHHIDGLLVFDVPAYLM
jgi:hypothetical protein